MFLVLCDFAPALPGLQDVDGLKLREARKAPRYAALAA
jgi:hypothetical protein